MGTFPIIARNIVRQLQERGFYDRETKKDSHPVRGARVPPEAPEIDFNLFTRFQ